MVGIVDMEFHKVAGRKLDHVVAAFERVLCGPAVVPAQRVSLAFYSNGNG